VSALRKLDISFLQDDNHAVFKHGAIDGPRRGIKKTLGKPETAFKGLLTRSTVFLNLEIAAKHEY
jgi:hypothetical protein